MSYLSAKKIYPGNWAEPLNGWYKNIDADYAGSNDAFQGRPHLGAGYSLVTVTSSSVVTWL
jgi:hypothetical protein